ncbi:MAG: MFS transporter [Alphaproteobacteria bacterium]
MTTKEPNTKLGGIGRAYADRNFRVYSVGAIASWISFFVQLVAVEWLAWQLTGSTLWLAVIGLMDILPNIVLMPFAGALADRYDRHRIMIITSSLALIQSVVLVTAALTGWLTILPLAVLTLAHGVIISFMVPAMFGTLPRFIAPKALSSAIAVSSSYTQLAIFAGPALAGWIILGYGIETAFAVNAAGYLLLVVSFLLLKTPDTYKQPDASGLSYMADIKHGILYLFQNPVLTWLLTLNFVTHIVASGFHHMAPAYVDTILDEGVIGLSTILSAFGAGAILSALWLAHRGDAVVRIDLVLFGVLVVIAALAGLMMTTSLYVAAAICVIFGCAAELRRTITMTIIQTTVDESVRGRVMGTYFMLAQLAAGIGTVSIGTVAEHHGLRLPVLIGCAIVLAVWAPIFLKRKSLLRLTP